MASNGVQSNQTGSESLNEYVQVYLSTEYGKRNDLDVKRFPKSLSVGDLKWRLEIVTGRSAKTMRITLLDNDLKLVCGFDDDHRIIGTYPLAKHGMTLLIEDPAYTSPQSEETDTTDSRFTLSDDQYASRKGTLKEFLAKNKIGKYNNSNKDSAKDDNLVIEMETIPKMKIGDRCEVTVPNKMPRRGVVSFVGPVKFQPGMWVGVTYDEPVGQNDGTVNDVRYFDTPGKNYGAFVKPAFVQIGDFPEIDEFDDEMEF